MSQPKTTSTRAAKSYLRCPACGTAELASTEHLTASCQGHATLTMEPGGELRRQFHHGDLIDFHWESSTTVGVECPSFSWSYQGADYLEQLTREEL